MSADDHSSDHVDAETEVPEEQIFSRASGRPPEEESSEDPERQAQVILEESEDRTTQGADKSTAS
jgi:hypothetical protein